MAFIDQYRTRFGVEPICRVLRERNVGIAPSTYYAYKSRPPSARTQRDAWLIEQIRQAHQDNYGVYGASKVWAQLNRQGTPVARCTVQRLMRQAGLRGVTRGRRKIRTTLTGAGTDYPVDLVERDFTASAPDRLWVADLTYIRTRAGWVYAAFIIDAYSKYIVGWQTATTLRASLAIDALEMALATRRRRNHERLVHHSDRGGQGGFKRSSQRLESEELRWKLGRFVGLIVRCGLRCGRLVVRRAGVVSIGSGFGKGSQVGCRARMLGWRLVCRLRLVSVGSARMAGWHLFLLSRFRGAICLLLTEKRSRFSTPATVGCVRSPAGWAGHRRRSPVSCAATPQPVAEAWNIGPRPRSGTRIGALAVRRRRSSLRTTSCAGMFRIALVALSPARTASWCQVPKCGGSVAVMGHERIDGGQARGAPSRSRTGSGSISPIMSP